jgi:peptide-methionine (S)-S-oxide reductase
MPEYYNLGDHSESIEIVFDPAKISYSDLLDVFWKSHNASVRPYSAQYKSIIFYHDEEQHRQALESRNKIEVQTGRKMLTEINPASTFFQAEDYHQKYYMQRYPELVREMMAIYPDINDYVYSTAVERINGYTGGFGAEESLQEELGNLGLSPEGMEKLREIAGKGLVSVCPVRS